MRRTMRLTRGAALAVSLALPAIEAVAQIPIARVPYPSSQQAVGNGPGGSSQFDGPGAMGADGTTGGSGAGVGAGANGGGAVGPDGAPLSAPGDPAGSGAFGGDGGAGAGAGAGAGGAGGAGAGAGGGGFSPNLGGFAGGSASPPGIVGDAPPITVKATRFPTLPNPVPPRAVNGGNPGAVGPGGSSSVIYKLTGLKIADNMSPVPQDRFFYSFNYFDNLNASVNKRYGIPVSNLQVYHQLFGLEKTFLEGKASLGFRVPLNTISLNTNVSQPGGLGGSHTSAGDLSIFAKYILYNNEGTLFTTGLQVTPPTGPGGFGGNKNYKLFRDVQIQPFVGYLFARDRFYLQGFSSVNVPTLSQDVTLFYNDVSMGYYVYRPSDPKKFFTAIVPTAEVHVTTPLNHRGTNPADQAATPDIVNLTFGTNLELKRRAVITAAYVTPVTGPKPFNAEFVLLFNLRFGGAARSSLPLIPVAQ